MDTLLRWLVQWKGRRRAAQVIVFDGGAEVERTRAFLKGALVGIALTVFVFLLAAPAGTSGPAAREMHQRDLLLRDADRRIAQAIHVTDVCLSTAEQLQQTLESYQDVLGGVGR